MRFSYLSIISMPAITVLAWEVKWYGGINLDCDTIPAGTTDFFVRTYSGHHLPSPCVPVNGSARGVRCHSNTYDYGAVASAEDCDRELGRGSAEVSGAGCCQFYSDEECGGALYIDGLEGVCYNEVVITAFRCGNDC